jgi:hypothetical protein
MTSVLRASEMPPTVARAASKHRVEAVRHDGDVVEA